MGELPSPTSRLGVLRAGQTMGDAEVATLADAAKAHTRLTRFDVIRESICCLCLCCSGLSGHGVCV